MTAALIARALRQHGAFTFRDALACGMTEQQVRRMQSAGLLVRLERGVFVDAQVWLALDDRGRHLCRAHGRQLVLGAGWVLAGRTAAVAHGLPLLGDVPTRPQLVKHKVKGSDRGRNRFERRAALPEQDVCVVDGMVATVLARSVVDLARTENRRSALVVADAALRLGLTADDLAATARRCSAWPGGTSGLWVARFADGLAETPIESISRYGMDEAGLPAPELQVEVYLGGRFLARPDFLWRKLRLVGQADGAVKYAEHPERGYAEKLQEEALEDAGLEVANWSWASAFRRDGDMVAKIKRGSERARHTTLDPRVRFVTTDLSRALRRSG